MRSRRWSTDKGRFSGDVYVLCLGIYSPSVGRELGVDLPIYPVKGYSITVPVAGRNNPPRIGGVDEENLIAYARSATASGSPPRRNSRATTTATRPDDFRHMLEVIRELFPDGADCRGAEYWAGLRPMTPQGTPILGHGQACAICGSTPARGTWDGP